MTVQQHPENEWTAGPWPIDYTGDGKRIVVGVGLVEGPNGYDVAEVYADDCPRETAEANARLIAAAPALYHALAGFEPFFELFAKLAGSAGDHEPNRLVVDARAALNGARGK